MQALTKYVHIDDKIRKDLFTVNLTTVTYYTDNEYILLPINYLKTAITWHLAVV